MLLPQRCVLRQQAGGDTMTKKVALTLSEQDVLEIEMIVRDQDRDAALEMVREIKRRMDAARRSICGQGTVTGSQPA
jgi:hypothetical protein